MAVKGSKNTKQHGTATKAGMMNKDSGEEHSNKNKESEKIENVPKISKEQSENREPDTPLH